MDKASTVQLKHHSMAVYDLLFIIYYFKSRVLFLTIVFTISSPSRNKNVQKHLASQHAVSDM